MGTSHLASPNEDKVSTKLDPPSPLGGRAFDPKTGEKKWEFKLSEVTDSGVLSTASDLVFSGRPDGYFFRLDGALLWAAKCPRGQ